MTETKGDQTADAPPSVQACAHANIALIKYWGKRDAARNLPATPSLSITLDELTSTTHLHFDPTLNGDQVSLNGAPATEGEQRRVSAVLDTLFELARRARLPARVASDNNFPTAAGLASSASGFAALVVAADHALGLDLPRAKLSELARRASGSAARSIFGGFVEMAHGVADDGHDAVAQPLRDASEWPLEVVIAITDTARKEIGSSTGMRQTALTSPYYQAWIDAVPADLHRARRAVMSRDFAELAAVSEASCLRMHASALAAEPPVIYWQPATLAVIERIRQLRQQGMPVFFTIDAGPQVKAICQPGHGATVEAELAAIDGVEHTLVTGLGGAARVLPETP